MALVTMDWERMVQDFVAAARDYCGWLEASPVVPPEQELLTALQLLSRLYACAAWLPEAEAPCLEKLDALPELPVEAIQAARDRLKVFPLQYYWEVFHAVSEQPGETVCGDVVDDLVDIYKDVKEGLVLYASGDLPLAVWHWRTTWGFHWGRHVVSALKAIQDSGEGGNEIFVNGR
jgi:hypothetical protein